MHNLFLARINRLPELLQLVMTPAAITLRQSSGWWNSRMRILAQRPLSRDTENSPAALTIELQHLLKEAGCTNKPMTVAIADAQVRMFMVTPPRNTTSLEDCQAAMTMRFRHLYGDDLSAWELQADWQANQPFLACAMPGWLLGALRNTAAEYRLTLLSVVPHFVTGWNRWHADLKDDGWFVMCHEEYLTLAAIDQKQLCAVRTSSLSASNWQEPQWLATLVAREALRLNLPVPQRMYLCGAVPDYVFDSKGALQCIRLDARKHAATGEAASSETAVTTSRGAL